jgi:hypothetical protein
MKRISWNTLFLVMALIFIMSDSLYASVLYSITDLGSGTVCDINNSGQILGSNGVWSSSQGWQVIDFGFTPTDINNQGEVVGDHYLWSSGTTFDLGFKANNINDLGQIAGYIMNWDINSGLPIGPNAVIWSDDTGITYIGVNGVAMSINNLGLVAGGQDQKPWVWSSQEGLRYLEANQNFNYVYDINEKSEVVGASWASPNPNDAYIPAYWSATGERTLIRPPEFNVIDGGLYSINNNSQAVGSLGIPFLWQDGSVTYLNDLISQNTGWSLSRAFGINDSGQIIGVGLLNGEHHSYLLTPSPAPVSEPSTMLLLGSALFGFFGLRKKLKS